jgi:hypothetical protein
MASQMTQITTSVHAKNQIVSAGYAKYLEKIIFNATTQNTGTCVLVVMS